MLLNQRNQIPEFYFFTHFLSEVIFAEAFEVLSFQRWCCINTHHWALFQESWWHKSCPPLTESACTEFAFGNPSLLNDVRPNDWLWGASVSQPCCKWSAFYGTAALCWADEPCRIGASHNFPPHVSEWLLLLWPGWLGGNICSHSPDGFLTLIVPDGKVRTHYDRALRTHIHQVGDIND